MAAVAIALALVAVPACAGNDASGVPEDLAVVLQGEVDAIWEAAVAGDATAVVARLDEVRGLVNAAQTEGTLPADAATRILVAADTVQARLGLLSGAPTTVPASDTTVGDPSSDGDDGDDEGDDDPGTTDAPDAEPDPDTTDPDTIVPDPTVPDTEPDTVPDTVPETDPPDTDPPETAGEPPATSSDG